MPCGVSPPHSSFKATPALRGICSALQPMRYSSRVFCFNFWSLSCCSTSAFLSALAMRWFMHSRCSRHPCLSVYTASPRGSPQAPQSFSEPSLSDSAVDASEPPRVGPAVASASGCFTSATSAAGLPVAQVAFQPKLRGLDGRTSSSPGASCPNRCAYRRTASTAPSGSATPASGAATSASWRATRRSLPWNFTLTQPVAGPAPDTSS
mmetsp:Transcript_107333/g.290845  ORF Transcript_107333/g.290845 Transcript_107333/m.290845 type:complete len:208 (+) Transcript_107333:2108-2731(+)